MSSFCIVLLTNNQTNKQSEIITSLVEVKMHAKLIEDQQRRTQFTTISYCPANYCDTNTTSSWPSIGYDPLHHLALIPGLARPYPQRPP